VTKKSAAQRIVDDPLWYKDAVIYQLHVKSFYDANGDGIGDFAGLIDKLDYIAKLGVNTVWLLPFYPSPLRDDGYDIADYRGVNPDYGRLSDARKFIAEAHRRGLRVITELVINHTSDQHPWFQRARHAKAGSKARDYYVWSDTDTRYAGTRIIFIDTEKSNWTYDAEAGAYYWHRFYSHQPDLNFDNPQVLKAILSAMRFWLDLGIDGLRLDAVPYLVERDGTNNENLPETHAVLKRIRAEIDRHYPGRMLLAEANQWPEDTQEYFGDGDECHMAFNFPLMPRIYMALAQEDRYPITDILRQTPDIPANCQWAIFLRNHDELTLEMVTDSERDYLWEKYASDHRARLNLGIRRRLAPLMECDRRRIELLNSLLLSMPGTPVIYYGDEIGMGDNIHLGDRDGVRTPMQWSPDRNGGFSRADPAALVLPPIMDPLYGYASINVEAQAHDEHSLLNWMRRMLSIRSMHHAFGRGQLKLLKPNNRTILAYLREHTDADGEAQAILCVANVSRMAQAVELDLTAYAERVPIEMIGGAVFPPIGMLPYLLTLPPFGFFWFLLASSTRLPSWHALLPEPLPDYITLVVRKDLTEILSNPSRTTLEREVLPDYLPKRRWFAVKQAKRLEVRIDQAAALPGARPALILSEIEVTSDQGTERYLLPMAELPDDETAVRPRQLALARVRRGRHMGWLTDAFAIGALAQRVLDLLREDATLPVDDGELRFIPTIQLAEIELPADAEVRWLSVEQSNSSLVIGDRMIVKLIRHISGGRHPEAEMGRVLTERGFANIAPLLGEVVRVGASGTPYVLMVVQSFIHNQGDAWRWTQNMLERALRSAGGSEQPEHSSQQTDALQEFAQFATVLGRRIGEMHNVLAQPSDDVAFAPQAATKKDCQHWAHAVQQRLDEALDLLKSTARIEDAEERKRAHGLLGQRRALHKAVSSLAARGAGSLRIRVHGDLHLGQILVSQGDAFIIDFEGEPARPLIERRALNSPLRDVAGMLRSFDYAAAVALRNKDGEATEVQHRSREVLAARFRQVSAEALVAAYVDAVKIAHRWQDDDAQTALVTLFTLEKAAYEVAYEAANRPGWLGVPLRGLADITDALVQDPTKNA